MPRVVFVLGAGASRPYGLPTSKELRAILLGTDAGNEALRNLGVPFERIVSFVRSRDAAKYSDFLLDGTGWEIPKGKNVARDFLDAALSSSAELEQFRHRFFGSQRVSIDAFISRNPDVEKIAKYAVAAVMLLCEREERLEGDWYQQFLERLMRKGARDDEFGVITFNYDRTFERYFQRAYLHNNPSDEILARKLYGRIKVIHAYGVLGTLEGTIMPPLVTYGGVNHFGYAADQLQLATAAHPPNGIEIRQMLEGVDRVVFLGFGFWKENIDLLELDPANPPEIYSSAFNLPATIIADMKAKYPKMVFGERTESLLDFVLSHAVFG